MTYKNTKNKASVILMNVSTKETKILKKRIKQIPKVKNSINEKTALKLTGWREN